jgi:hypothetical protein
VITLFFRTEIPHPEDAESKRLQNQFVQVSLPSHQVTLSPKDFKNVEEYFLPNCDSLLFGWFGRTKSLIMRLLGPLRPITG